MGIDQPRFFRVNKLKEVTDQLEIWKGEKKLAYEKNGDFEYKVFVHDSQNVNHCRNHLNAIVIQMGQTPVSGNKRGYSPSP